MIHLSINKIEHFAHYFVGMSPVLIIAVAFLGCQAITSEQNIGEQSNAKWLFPRDQFENNIVFEIEDETIMLHVSDALDTTTSIFAQIVKELNATFVDDLQGLVAPLNGIIPLLWSCPDELFRKNLNFLFDRILEIAYCTYESLETVRYSATVFIETKIRNVSQHIVSFVESVASLNKSENKKDFAASLSVFNETVAGLTFTIVGFTTCISTLIRLIFNDNSSMLYVVGSIAALQIIHLYTLSTVACAMSRAVKVLNSLIVVSETDIPFLLTTIITYVVSLPNVFFNNVKGTSMTELFNVNLLSLLSKRLVRSVNGYLADKIILTINTTTTFLYNIIDDYTVPLYRILPDLLSQLMPLLYRCGQIPFSKLERRLTYNFDGLLDSVHYISYDLNKDFKAWASTSSYNVPSEPIDIALERIRENIKTFTSSVGKISSSKKANINDLMVMVDEIITDMVNSTNELIIALVTPMTTVLYRESYNNNTIALVSSLQFIVLYIIGLIATPLLLARTILQNYGVSTELYLNVRSTFTLALIKFQLIFDDSKLENCWQVLESVLKAVSTFSGDLSDVLGKVSNVIGESKYLKIPWNYR